MAKILIFDNQPHRREHLVKELEKEGYDVKAISEEEFDLEKLDTSTFDLAVLNLYPDALRTWEIYYLFRKFFPGFPVLVYLIKNIYAVKSLKISIKEILKKHSPYQLSKKKIYSSTGSYGRDDDPVFASGMNGEC